MKTFSFPEQCGNVTALAWSPTGHQIAAACDDGTAIVWSVSSGEVVFCRCLTRTRLLTISWTENGRCLVLGSEDNTLTVIQVRDGDLVLTQVFDAPIKKISFAPRGRRLLVAVGKAIYLYNGRTGLNAQGDDQGMISVRQKPPGKLLWRSKGQHDGHDKRITVLAWSPDGRYLASGSADTTVKIWEAATGTVLQTYIKHATAICALAWSPGGDRIISAADHEQLHLWMPCFSSPTRTKLSRIVFRSTEYALRQEACNHAVCSRNRE